MACENWKRGSDSFSYREFSGKYYWFIKNSVIDFCPFCGNKVDSDGCTNLSNEDIIESLEYIAEDYNLAEEEKNTIEIAIKRLRENNENKNMEVL